MFTILVIGLLPVLFGACCLAGYIGNRRRPTGHRKTLVGGFVSGVMLLYLLALDYGTGFPEAPGGGVVALVTVGVLFFGIAGFAVGTWVALRRLRRSV